MNTAVLIRREVRKGKKVITRIGEIPHNPQVIKEWASELKTICGAGGTVLGKWIELQGDQVEKSKQFIVDKGLKVR